MSRAELIERFTLERVQASPAVWNYDKLDHMNGYYIRQLAPEDLAGRLIPFFEKAGWKAEREKVLQIVPLIRERIKRLSDAVAVADFFFLEKLPPYDAAELIPKKGDVAMALAALERAREALEKVEFTRGAIEAALRSEAEKLGVKAGQMFHPIRVAISGRKVSPPLFESLEVLGKETSLARIDEAIAKLRETAG